MENNTTTKPTISSKKMRNQTAGNRQEILQIRPKRESYFYLNQTFILADDPTYDKVPIEALSRFRCLISKVAIWKLSTGDFQEVNPHLAFGFLLRFPFDILLGIKLQRTGLQGLDGVHFRVPFGARSKGSLLGMTLAEVHWKDDISTTD